MPVDRVEGPLFIPDGYYEVSLHMQATGSLREAVCTQGVEYTGSSFDVDANDMLDAWADDVMLSVSDNWTYFAGRMRNQIGTVKDRAETTGGGTSHSPATPNVSFLILKNTGQPGRFNRGRMYLPGVSEQDVDGLGVVVGSKLTELVTNIGAWYTRMAADHFTPVILHRDVSIDGGVTFTHRDPTPQTSFDVSALAATQRRRMRR